MNIDSRINKYIENKQNKNYDCDFTSSNANSYELWMKQRCEIKKKQKLLKILTWLLNKPNIIWKKTDLVKTNRGQTHFGTWCKSNMLHNFKALKLKLRPNDIGMTSN
jgi:hypothetical protein